MKSYFLNLVALTFIAISLVISGCATGSRAGNSGGTASLPMDPSAVQGRDLGRGGGTSGGVSSLDPSGNAADWSVYDARQQAAR